MYTRHQKLTEEIQKLKIQRNAIILAHVYQRGEVQDIADYLGDSLELSRKAVNTNADVIVFCGVQFMAETAAIIVHPECSDSVRHMADFVGSTSQMSTYVKQSALKEFIVGTEDNFVYRLKSDNPDNLFHRVNTLCKGMNTITLEKVKNALEKIEYKVAIPKITREKAKTALEKMLAVS